MIDVLETTTIEAIRDNPSLHNWSQSPLEEIADIRVLLDARAYILIMTEFLAPKLVKSSGARTEDIGEVHRREFIDDAPSPEEGRREWIEFEKEARREIARTHAGKALHNDYTLWVSCSNYTAFVNMRMYPDRCFLVDLIASEIGFYHEEVQVISSNLSLMGEDVSGIFLPQRRTRALPQFIRINSPKQVILERPDGEYIGHLRDCENICFQNGLHTLFLFELEYEERYDLLVASRARIYKQQALSLFRRLLDECCIEYRKK